MTTKPNYDQMSSAQLRMDMQRNCEKTIAILNEKIEQQRRVIQAYENADAWRAAIRTGQTTIEQMQAAFDFEEQGEVTDPLPEGYVRHEGKIVRVGRGDEVTQTDTTPDDDGFDVNASFLSSGG